MATAKAAVTTGQGVSSEAKATHQERTPWRGAHCFDMGKKWTFEYKVNIEKYYFFSSSQIGNTLRYIGSHDFFFYNIYFLNKFN